MITKKTTYECLTPCFCAGANQAQREIRVASIRGALRWWFRCLGGSLEQETETFGGGPTNKASAIQIRVSNISEKPVGQLPQVNGIDPKSYILFFASVSADKTRWNPNACYGTGTKFDLQIRQLRKISEASRTLLEETLTAFDHFGGIGMRITRGLGALQSIDATEDSFNSAVDLIKKRGFSISLSHRNHKVWDTALKEAGQWLQNDLRKEFGAGGNKKPRQSTALGAADPRQTSAVYLRVRKLNDQNLQMFGFEAPHIKVLGEISRRKHHEPILASRDFSQAPPTGG